jgi:hypothetical protein
LGGFSDAWSFDFRGNALPLWWRMGHDCLHEDWPRNKWSFAGWGFGAFAEFSGSLWVAGFIERRHIRVFCDLSGAEQLAIVAAGGLMRVPVVRIPWFSCLGRRVEDFSVVALDLPSNAFTSGLLGMDFMQRFGVVIDTAKGELRC